MAVVQIAGIYIDYDNGDDTHSGNAYSNLFVSSTSDTTHFVSPELTSGTDDYYNGDYVWFVTQEEFAHISDYNGTTKEITLDRAITGLSVDDEFEIILALKTIIKGTAFGATRVPGDKIMVRAGTTAIQTGDTSFDEDGDEYDYIYLIGCDSTTNDPWHDESDTTPIIDFNDSAYNIVINGDYNWRFENLDFRQSSDAYGMINVYSGSLYLKNCILHDTVNIPCLRETYGDYVILEGCELKDVGSDALVQLRNSGQFYAINTTFDGGSVRGAQAAIEWSSGGGICYFENCSLGETNNFTIVIFRQQYAGCRAFLRNCTYDGTLNYFANPSQQFSFTKIEDDDGVYGNHATYYYTGSISKETSSPRSGGGISYAKLESNSHCGLIEPLILGDPIDGFAKIYLEEDVEVTVTVYARTGSAWDSALSSSEAFLRCSYLSNATTAARTKVDSTETITNDAAWTAFTVTFTPLQNGFAYLWFYLAEYEDASEYIDVDVFGYSAV